MQQMSSAIPNRITNTFFKDKENVVRDIKDLIFNSIPECLPKRNNTMRMLNMVMTSSI